MARIFRQTYTKPLSGGADVFRRGGKEFTRFKDTHGKVRVAPLSKDGKNVIRKTSKWYVEYRDAGGMIKRVAGYTDRKATEQYASELERTAEHVRSGYKPKEHEQLGRPLPEHIEDFSQYLGSKGNTKDYVSQTVKRVRQVFDNCGYLFWSDITASQIMNCIAAINYRGKNLSTQTFNYYLQSVKQFCRWMVQDRRAGESPVEHLKKVTVVPTFERRAATPDEVRILLEAAEAAPKHFGLTGHERAMLYRFAAETGLRAKEIRTLRVSSFDFGDCVVMTPAGYTKNKDKIAQPLRKETVPVLEEFFRSKMPNAPAFKMPSKYNVARMLKADLLNTGIPYFDDLNRKFDFHSLRHTFITTLRSAPTRVAQSLARHRSSKMTDRYTHIGLVDERAVIEESIPDYSLPSSQERNVATGTDVVVALDDYNKPDNKPSKKLDGDMVQPTEIKRVKSEMKDGDTGFLIRRSQVRVLPGVVHK